ncbi:tautomerase [Haladaptatus halobius]|uniref:tautomerase n=1 Tax=Haladaptatus halobius TaxID=2884875 RepID=UPI001D0AE5D7|nr:tautomerase [Haladaptatus halobius]
MPLLQFDTTLSLSDQEKESFAMLVMERYAEEMTEDHVAITLRKRDSADVYLGRAVDGPLLFLDAEIRQGRPFEYKRAFALAVMEYAADQFEVPETNLKVIFTEHRGNEMMGIDRVGGKWDGE